MEQNKTTSMPEVIEINTKDYLRSVCNLLTDAIVILRKESEPCIKITAARKMLDAII